jgi:hypothetical protein
MGELSGFERRCTVCEQTMCDYSRRAAIQRDDEADAQKRQIEREAQDSQQDTPLNHGIHQDEDEQSKPETQRPPAPPLPITGSSPNPKLSNISAQITILHTLRILQPVAPDSVLQTLEHLEIGHTCCTPAARCEILLYIDTDGCGHFVGHACLQRWMMIGKNWCRFCGKQWFRKEHDHTLRMAMWKEGTDTGVVAFDLWVEMPEDGDGLQDRDEDGGIGEGEWEDILRREMGRTCVRGYQTDDGNEVLKSVMGKMDPNLGLLREIREVRDGRKDSGVECGPRDIIGHRWSGVSYCSLSQSGSW